MVHPHTETGQTVLLIAIVVVGLFVCIFNAYKMGWFRRK